MLAITGAAGGLQIPISWSKRAACKFDAQRSQHSHAVLRSGPFLVALEFSAWATSPAHEKRGGGRRTRTACYTRCSADKEMAGEEAGPSVYPVHRCKTIHLIRHGQGFHNVAGEQDRAAYLSPEFLDASLTPMGWQQVGMLRNHIKANGIADSVQLVVVSPLTRTMQTAVGVFGGEDITNVSPGDVPLMVDGVGMAKHKAISSKGAPRHVSVEWCREHMGIHPCDKRQSIKIYKTLFPAIDFSDVESDEDLWWSPVVRETDDELFARARIFVRWLLKRSEKEIAVVSHSGFLFQMMRAVSDEECSSTVQSELRTQLLKREEKEIAVVSHSSFLRHLMATFGDDCSPPVQKELRSYFANCEMRSVILADRRATEAWQGAKTDFAGGILPVVDKAT